MTLRKESLILTFTTLVMALIFWFQISPFTFKEYARICTANHGHSAEYDRCMNPYWSQNSINKAGLIISLGLTGIFIVIFIIKKLSQKQRSS